jgi:hypothetical protein
MSGIRFYLVVFGELKAESSGLWLFIPYVLDSKHETLPSASLIPMPRQPATLCIATLGCGDDRFASHLNKYAANEWLDVVSNFI